jgi:DNA repair exonuclease SbcCD ATPase subunit
LRLRAQREELCKRVEWLIKAEDWEKGKAEAERLAGLWQTLEGDAEPDLAERFEALQGQFHSAWQDWQARQANLAALRAEKQALCESVNGVLAELDNGQSLDTEQSQNVDQELATLETRWAQIESIGGVAEAEFQRCFEGARRQARARQRELELCHRIAEHMRAVCEDAERLLAAARPLSKHGLENLSQRWNEIEKPATPSDLIREYQARFEQASRLIEEAREKQHEAQKQREKDLKQTLRDLDVALAEGELQKARQLESAAKDLLGQLGHLPKPRRAGLEHALQKAEAKIRELRGWQHWGNTLERERLCEQAESLIGLEGDPEDIARRIREAQEEWKKTQPGR